MVIKNLNKKWIRKDYYYLFAMYLPGLLCFVNVEFIVLWFVESAFAAALWLSDLEERTS